MFCIVGNAPSFGLGRCAGRAPGVRSAQRVGGQLARRGLSSSFRPALVSQARRVAAFATFARRAGATLGAHETALIEAAADERVAGAALGRASGELDDAVEEALEWVRDEIARNDGGPEGSCDPQSPAPASPSSELVAIERTRLETLSSRARESVSSALESRAATAGLRRVAAEARLAAGEQGGVLGARLGDVPPALEECETEVDVAKEDSAPLQLEAGSSDASPLDAYDPAWRFRSREARRERLREAQAEAAELEAVAGRLERTLSLLRRADRAIQDETKRNAIEDDTHDGSEREARSGEPSGVDAGDASSRSPFSPGRRLAALSAAASASLVDARTNRRDLDAAVETWWRVPALDAAPWARRDGKTARQWAADAERGPTGGKDGGRRDPAGVRRPFADAANRA